MKQNCIISACIALLLCTVARADNSTEAVGEWNPKWDYGKHGEDWNFTNCNNSRQVQSPVDLLPQGHDWWALNKSHYAFSFLPTYKSVAVPTKRGEENHTYTIHGDFGQVFINEASDYEVTQAIKWEAEYIKFHYPSEHKVAGAQMDLEMQIYHREAFWTHAVCVSGIGVVSLLFNVTKEDNPFFNFLIDETAPIDLASLIPIDFAMKHYFVGYVGSNSVPNCERGVCWYIVKDVMGISQAQLDKLKIPGVTFNNRATNNVTQSYRQYDAPGLYYQQPQ